MRTTETTRRAEAAATSYLEMRGFNVVEQNFRRPHCAIDIVATKDDVAFLIDVTYQRNDSQTEALDFMTDSQLRQRRDAAATWADENKWLRQCRWSVIEVVGKDFVIMHFIENVM
ncbi:MAG: YraN family protein [Candidatus Saccharibacteria bacterium]